MLLLSGPTAAGKNTVAGEMAARLANCAVVDFDAIRTMFTKPHKTPWDGAEGLAQQQLGIQMVCDIAERFGAEGWNVIILDVVTAETLELYRLRLGESLKVVQLCPRYEVLLKRFDERGPVLTYQQLADVYQKQLDFTGYDLQIDNAELSPGDVAERILSFFGCIMFAFVGEKPDLFALDIVGERVRLVSISEAFTETIFATFSHEVTTYMFPKPADSTKETEAFISSSLAGFEAGDNIQLVILDKTTAEFLGCCGLHGDTDPKNPELGVWLKPSAQGKGLGKEAIHALVFWAAERLQLDAFVYPVDKRNVPSRRIPLSLAASVVAKRQETGMAGNSLDLLIYKIPLPIRVT